MKRLLAALIFILLAAPGSAQSFIDFRDAFERGDYATALRGFRPLAEQGDANAQYKLGYMYNYGLGVPQNSAEAAKWYGRAADQSDANAQYKLGRLYFFGLGVPTSYAEAAKWYGRAADQSDANAQYKLGSMYFSGQGVPVDYVVAYMWLNLSAAQGLETSAMLRKILTESIMTPAQIAEAQRMAREWLEAHPK